MIQTQIATDESYRGALPSNFKWGFASASYQIEGGRDERGDCPWDVLLKDKDKGDLCADSFHLFEEDLKLLKSYGATAYRFSVSWCRIIPKGGHNDPINEAGLAYYKQIVDRLVEEGIVPWITIFHWDTPLQLHNRYGGWVDVPEFYRDFLRFCRVCFETFGDKCKNWMTINEEVDPWKLGRVILLAHAKCVELYRNEFQAAQGGRIGVVLNAEWVEPIDDSKAARECANRARQCQLGWFADPIFNGYQNSVLAKRVGAKFPTFTPEETALIHYSSDFFGINHYGSAYATGRDLAPEKMDPLTYLMGQIERIHHDAQGNVIGKRGQNGHPYNVPWGFRKLLQFIHNNYIKDTDIPIVIGENGFPVEDEAVKSLEEIVDDIDRQEYFAGYIKELVDCVRDDGVMIDAYMAWSLIDNLEWAFGFYPRFGVTHIDREHNCNRTPKDSSRLLGTIFGHVIAWKAE